jgi:tyrosinase
MATVRQDIATLGGTWNDTILWYARAMVEMWARPIDNRRSWRYLAAVHGADLAANGWQGQGIFDPRVERLPDPNERAEMWDQCQHAGWYFLPWHRGYVAAFEAIVAQTIKDIGGPVDWALPYWNYLNAGNPNAKRIPAAFTEAQLPDGSGNPLAMFARTPTQELNTLLTGGSDINLNAMGRPRFTGSPGANGLGGSQTGFAHFGPNGSGGALEGNPHNFVHVMAGGLGGYLSDPNYAALDPLFWLHHCNIDRMWAAWLTKSTNVQENGAVWLQGPTPRQFAMPGLDGGLQVFTPSDTLPGARLDPVYDDLFKGTGVTPPQGGVPASVGGPLQGGTMPAQLSDKAVAPPQLLGSNTESLIVGVAPVMTHVKLAGDPMPAAAAPYRLYAYLENIQGVAPSGTLTVSVGVRGQRDVLAAESAVLFGLQKASTEHGGNGLNASIDITDQVKTLAAKLTAAPDALDVQVKQPGPLAIGKITVGKVSILRQTDE